MPENRTAPSPGAPEAEELYLRACRTTTWAGWLSMSIVGLFALLGMGACAYSEDGAMLGLVLGLWVLLPVAWVVLTALALRAVRRRDPRAPHLMTVRAALSFLPFLYLIGLGILLVIGILFLPPVASLSPIWIAMLVAEIYMIVAAVRVRRAWRALAIPD
ncbi:MAG TPA: hypothetical protein PK668_00700 [Myxococcota bacterium]|nr:hypothetical protein [Myxococcota bacterium]HRY95649.1 hypothetical protein [Myxococcota bacterium]HSA23724.1 hypothetical protein [Myxococcota bacterium]